MIIALGIYLMIGFLLSTAVVQKMTDPLSLFVQFWVVVVCWPYILWRSLRKEN